MGLCFGQLRMSRCSPNPFVQSFLSANELNKNAADKQDNNIQLFLRHITKKCELLSDADDFQMVDHHAQNAPTEMMTSNVDKLLNYLMSSCGSSLNTVRTVYVWVLTHIKCNDRSLCDTDLDIIDPLVVLGKKEGSPSDINVLFHHLCQELSVPCVFIQGVVRSHKDDLHKQPMAVDAVNHVWSLVLVKSQWRFVDCTCGGGYLDPEDVDRGEALETFFLTDPEVFILSHYPVRMPNQKFLKTAEAGNHALTFQAEETLQMLDSPISFSDFCSRSSPTVYAVSNSVHLMTHSRAHVVVKRNETFEFSAPLFVNMAAVLSDCSSGHVVHNTVLATRSGNSRYRIFVKPKCVGDYKFTVFGAKEDNRRTSFRTVVIYSLHVEEAENQFSPMPDLFGVWGPIRTAPQYGFTDSVFRYDVLTSRSGEICIKLPVNRFVQTKSVLKSGCGEAADALFSSNQSTLNQLYEGVVHIRARFPLKGFYSLSLQAPSHDDDGGTEGAVYATVANFFISCLTPSLICSGYPHSYPDAQNTQTLLLEPLSCDLVVNETVVFRLRSILLTSATVDGEEMVRGTTDCPPDDDGGDEDTWRLKYTPTRVGVSVCIRGMVANEASVLTLYRFCVVRDNIVTVSTHM
ncbi:hypothetical protein Btru_064872 [Bulinus truncatus]|nr:hypothetical protein Btru_064872 [Bulinus truncatus]